MTGGVRLSRFLRKAVAMLCLCCVGFVAVNEDGNAASVVDPTVVMTDKGAVRGVVRDGVREFKGIPYAQAPVGELRWAPPQPVSAWTETLDATQYRSICPQVERYGIPESSEDEDCLHLNVTAPYKGVEDLSRKRPVLVWLHGGAFVGGSSALYPLDYMATRGDVVMVSMNYRLGVFGFTAHPSFDADHNGGYGLEDQRAALRWVRRNIAAFGGDPDTITIAGESAGGSGVCMHLLAPDETRGLFHKAIIMSAGCVTPLPSVDDANKIGRQIASEVGCDEENGALACLRGKTVKELLDAGTKVAGSNILTFMPSIGNKTNPLPGAQAFPAGEFVQVPVIYGGTRDELRLYVAYAMQAGQKITEENYEALLKQTYDEKSEAIAKQYPVGKYSSAPAALGTVWSDFRPDVGLNHCIYLESAKLIRKLAPVYQYVFADGDAPPVTTNPGFEMGAVHSSELPYMFPHYDNTRQLAGPDLAPASQKLAEQMVDYFTHFAREGQPVAEGAPEWDIFDRDDRVMNFEPGNLGYFNAAAAHYCTFWKSLYPDILTQSGQDSGTPQ
ncbi:para-nitrobenzyl esterase [Desulfonatronum zhilinae]|nr:para-nitrobenzyl esterase [Desulfonatronum zhilinae]